LQLPRGRSALQWLHGALGTAQRDAAVVRKNAHALSPPCCPGPSTLGYPSVAALFREYCTGKFMRPNLVRNILLPAHEALMGRPTLSIVRQLADPAFPHDSITHYQAGKLAELVAHARMTCPYWRDTLGRRDATGASGAAARTKELATNTTDFPILTRADVRRHRESMKCQSAPGKLIYHSSSGTTDDNLIFYLDRQRQAWDRALRIHALARLGVQVGEKQLHFMPQFGAGGRLGWLKDGMRRVRDRLTSDIAFDVRPMTAERLSAALRVLHRYRPALIVGYPSALFALARHQLETGEGRGITPPRYILTTGELLYEFQRRTIESAFGARVVEEYGCQELGVIASEDDRGEWLVNWQHLIVEILRGGRPAHAGEMGEIVVTNLHSRAMPLVRYATGDVVTAPRAPRDPEMPITVLPRIEGRTSDVLITTDGRPQSNRELVDLLVQETGVSEFSLHQTAPDRVLCMTIRHGGWAGQEAKVTTLLRSILGRTLRVEWKIGTAFRPLKSGKRRYLCSSVAQSVLAHDRESGMFLSRAWPQRVLDAA
jgi:phenylacetate-CoA ligase